MPLGEHLGPPTRARMCAAVTSADNLSPAPWPTPAAPRFIKARFLCGHTCWPYLARVLSNTLLFAYCTPQITDAIRGVKPTSVLTLALLVLKATAEGTAWSYHSRVLKFKSMSYPVQYYSKEISRAFTIDGCIAYHYHMPMQNATVHAFWFLFALYSPAASGAFKLGSTVPCQGPGERGSNHTTAPARRDAICKKPEN
ncbi:unnamed protein product, partial [Iphiclides podalirius]